MSIAPMLAKKLDFRWWLSKADKNAMFQTFEHIQKHDAERRELNLRNMRLYSNRHVRGYAPLTYEYDVTADRVTLNVVKSTSDTVVSRIAKNRPRPRFLTSGGNYSLQRRARLLEKFVEAQFYNARVYQNAPKVFLDGCVFGTGVFKVFREDKKICCERIFPGELFVDPAEGFYGEPQSIYQMKYINRDVLYQMFPGKKKIIQQADNGFREDFSDGFREDYDNFGRDSTADQVRVIEGWHLPSGPGAGDGKHVIAVKNGQLFSEEWDRDHFPFVFTRWSDRLRGFWGMGLAEELTGLQVEINKLLVKIQRSHQLLAVPWVMVEASSKIKKAHLNNQIGAIIP